MSTESQPTVASSDAQFPTALVKRDHSFIRRLQRSTWWVWALTGLCLLFAIVLSFRAIGPRGLLLTVRFRDGHGLKVEDAVRYRGIDVGDVERVRLRDQLDGVDVAIRLRPDAEAIAREGSQFWIERPQLSLARMSGLDTVVGVKYVGVIPGCAESQQQKEFTGIEQPPRLRQVSDVSIMVSFRDGHGISPGNVVKYRGIIVGEVTDVRLNESLSGVEVRAQLIASAVSLAQSGTLFWVEHPQVSLQEGIRGLETLAGGQYLALMPNPSDGEPQTEFVGAEQPPADMLPVDGGLAVSLVAEERHGLERGATVTYRGIATGQVTNVALADNGGTVNVRIVVFPKYRYLIRTNTQFWSRSAVDMQLGFRGLDIDVDPTSLTSAVAFATPQPAGEAVDDGHQFELSEKEADGWKDWKPLANWGKSFRESRNGDAEQKEDRPARGILDRIRTTFEGADDAVN